MRIFFMNSPSCVNGILSYYAIKKIAETKL